MRKLTFEYVKQYFKEQRCELLETKYEGNKAKIRYICSCGNSSKTTFNTFKQGHRCQRCGGIKRNRNKKFSLEYAKQYFEEKNCKLLEDKYKNVDTLMTYICSCGNASEIRLNDFKRGVRCQKCRDIKSGEDKRFSFEYVYDYFKEQGCELLENKYKNSNTAMKYICNCGKQSKTTFSTFKDGHRCQECGLKKISGKNHCNYNPNLTDDDRIDRRLIKGYLQWVKDVYKKDNYICQKCGNRNSRKNKLNAHHIEGYAENEDLRMDLDNGITFCQKCHQKFHVKYGKKNISRKHLDMFLK